MKKSKIFKGGALAILILLTHSILFYWLILMSDVNKIKDFLGANSFSFPKFFAFFLSLFCFIFINIMLGKISEKYIFENKNAPKDKSLGVGSVFGSIWSSIKTIFSVIFGSLFLSMTYVMFDKMINDDLFKLSESSKKVTSQIIFWACISLCIIIGIITTIDLFFTAKKIIDYKCEKNKDQTEFSYSFFCISNFAQLIINEKHLSFEEKIKFEKKENEIEMQNLKII